MAYGWYADQFYLHSKSPCSSTRTSSRCWVGCRMDTDLRYDLYRLMIAVGWIAGHPLGYLTSVTSFLALLLSGGCLNNLHEIFTI